MMETRLIAIGVIIWWINFFAATYRYFDGSISFHFAATTFFAALAITVVWIQIKEIESLKEKLGIK